MELAAIYDRIYNKLSGGKKVKLEVDKSVVVDAVSEAFEKVKGWYYEPKQAETLVSRGTGSQRYLLKAELTLPVRRVHKLYNTTTIRSSAGSLDSMLYGIPNTILDPSGIVEQTYYQEFATSLEQFNSDTLEYFESSTKILLSGDYDPSVCVSYYPQPLTAAQVTVQKAIDWINGYSLGSVMVSVGRVRSKFRGGDLDVEMDGQELVSEGNEKMARLEEKLATLDFRY